MKRTTLSILGIAAAAATVASGAIAHHQGRPDAGRSASTAFFARHLQLGSPPEQVATPLLPTVPGPPAAPAAETASETPLGAPPEAGRARRRNSAAIAADKVPPAPDSSEVEDVEYGEAANPTSTKLLTYRGGAVQQSPRIYLVLWGPSWFTGGDPNGVAARLHYFYQGVGGSSWANVLKQYTSNYGTFGNPSGQYRGWLQDTTPVPQFPTMDEVAQAARRAAARVNDLSYNTQFVIAMPWGVVDQNSTLHGWCGWHNYTYVGSSWITYTSLPYTPYMDTLGRGCGGGRVNGSNGKLDGVTIIAGHEYAESVNNPSLTAYLDADGSENGDKCSWTNLQNRTLANGYAFPVQPSWSNQWRNQYGYGCYYS
jgi:hypothetical protein